MKCQKPTCFNAVPPRARGGGSPRRYCSARCRKTAWLRRKRYTASRWRWGRCAICRQEFRTTCRKGPLPKHCPKHNWRLRRRKRADACVCGAPIPRLAWKFCGPVCRISVDVERKCDRAKALRAQKRRAT